MHRWCVWSSTLVVVGFAGCGENAAPTPSIAKQSASIDATTPNQLEANVESVDLVRASHSAITVSHNPDAQTQQAEHAFARLVKAAEEGDPRGWEAANQELQQLGAAAMPVLIPALHSDKSLWREMAVTFLAQLGPEAAPAADDLAALLLDASPIIRVNAAAALSALEQPLPASIDALTELASHEDVHVRETAVSALGNAGRSAETVLPVLAKCLADEEIRVRTSAAVAIGQFGQAAQEFVPKLRLLSGDEDPNVRNAVTTALELIEADGKTVPAGLVDP